MKWRSLRRSLQIDTVQPRRTQRRRHDHARVVLQPLKRQRQAKDRSGHVRDQGQPHTTERVRVTKIRSGMVLSGSVQILERTGVSIRKSMQIRESTARSIAPVANDRFDVMDERRARRSLPEQRGRRRVPLRSGRESSGDSSMRSSPGLLCSPLSRSFPVLL
jgi:hypothetical protein